MTLDNQTSEKDWKKAVIDFFFEKNILLSKDFLEQLTAQDAQTAQQVYTKLTAKVKDGDFLLLTADINKLLEQQTALDYNWRDLEHSRVLFEKKLNCEPYQKIMSFLSNKEDLLHQPAHALSPTGTVSVVFSYKDEAKKRNIQDFVAYFNSRYRKLKSILQNRQELQGVTSISRLKGRGGREEVALIGMILDKQTTKNGNIIIELEDPTGMIKIMVNKEKQELKTMARDLVYDEVIGITGTLSNDFVYVNSLYLPEIPLHKELKKAPDEAYAIFLSDTHFGSKQFLVPEFEKFIKWIRGETGSEKQRQIAQKVQYLFLVGDVVDGVGIYPNQERELIISDIYEQYAMGAEYLKQIPGNIHIIICPGNHDAMRISEPQPTLYKDFAKALWELPNVTFVSNPAMVNIHSSPTFPGFDVLMYHGYSFDYYVANVEGIRQNGGYHRGDLLMKFLLQRRHLAPAHSSTLYLPTAEDHLVIERIPDIFATGHIHYAAAAMYKNITLLCSSCWQGKTTFQEKMGHTPEPARVPAVNLKTREVKVLRF